jgi:hypothetical protein
VTAARTRLQFGAELPGLARRQGDVEAQPVRHAQGVRVAVAAALEPTGVRSPSHSAIDIRLKKL